MSGWPSSRTAASVAVAAMLSVAGAGVAFASTGTSRQAARLYAQAQRAVDVYQGVTFTGGGTSYRILKEPGYQNFEYYAGSVPSGYRRAVDHVLVVLRHGKVSEEVDTLSAKGLPHVRIWLDNTHGFAVGKVLDRHGCPVYFSGASAIFVTVGQHFGFANGPAFTSASRSGKRWIVRSTYPLSGGTAQESDALNAASKRWISTYVKVKGGPYNGDHLSAAAFGYKRRQRAEAPPALGPC